MKLLLIWLCIRLNSSYAPRPFSFNARQDAGTWRPSSLQQGLAANGHL
jgi:hypothetical protein